MKREHQPEKVAQKMLMVLEVNLSGESCRNALGPDPPCLGLQVQPICLPPRPNSSRAEEEGDTPVFRSKAARKMYPLEGTPPRQNKPATTKNVKAKSQAMETGGGAGVRARESRLRVRCPLRL